MTSSANDRITILENILLKLHNGLPAEAVQEEFNQHFSEVSAIEISMMEHQIIFGDNEITFEDVLKLCNVHAQLFKDRIQEKDGYAIDHPGHPVAQFKAENQALQAAALRINNILKALNADAPQGLLNGLSRQLKLLGQFDNHYKRKEHLFFPLLEKYGHDAPPKVMWAKDDEIRGLFRQVTNLINQFPESTPRQIMDAFQLFEAEFIEMVFKEESILLNILLEVLSEEDWHQINQLSDTYGYAIVRPTQQWEPSMKESHPSSIVSIEKEDQNLAPHAQIIQTQKVRLREGYLTVSFEPHASDSDRTTTSLLNPNVPMPIGDGFLSLEQLKLIFDYIPADFLFFDHTDHLRYSNVRTSHPQFLTTKRSMGLSAQQYYSDSDWHTIYELLYAFKKEAKKQDVYWYKQGEAFIYREIKALYDSNGVYQGFVDIFQDIQPILSITTKKWRDLLPYDQVDLSLKSPADLTQINHGPTSSQQNLELPFNEGMLQLGWLPLASHTDTTHSNPDNVDYNQAFAIGLGQLSLNQARYILDAMPFEISYVDESHIFRYFNNAVPYDEMLFKRTPLEIGRDLEYCHPPMVWPKVKQLSEDFRHQRRFEEAMWLSPFNKLIYILYKGTQDHLNNYRGIVETVQDGSVYTKLIGTEKRFMR